MLGALTLFGEGHLFGTGDVRPLLVGYGLDGFFNCILWFIPQSMLADVADESELITGRRARGRAVWNILLRTADSGRCGHIAGRWAAGVVCGSATGGGATVRC